MVDIFGFAKNLDIPWKILDSVMTWSRDLAYSSRKNKLHLSSFHPKILHTSLSTPTPLATAMTSRRRYFRTDSDTTYSRTDSDTTYSRTDSDTTSHTSALALSGAEVLRVFQSRCLVAGSREKTTYRSAPFWIWWWWSERGFLTLYKGKPLEEPRVKWWEDGWPDAVRPDSWDVNISF